MAFAVDQLGRLAAGEFGMVGHVGGAGDVVLVPRDEDIVLGQHQIGLDEIGAVVDREIVARQRMFGTFAARPAMADDDGIGKRLHPVTLPRHGRRSQYGDRQYRRGANSLENRHVQPDSFDVRTPSAIGVL